REVHPLGRAQATLPGTGSAQLAARGRGRGRRQAAQPAHHRARPERGPPGVRAVLARRSDFDRLLQGVRGPGEIAPRPPPRRRAGGRPAPRGVLRVSALLLMLALLAPGRETLSLDGTWQLHYDPKNRGLLEKWAEAPPAPSSWYDEQVPACLEEYETGAGY